MNNDMTYKIIYKVIEIWDKDIEATFKSATDEFKKTGSW